MITLIFGILSSIFAELVSWFNKKLEGTTLHGDASFIIALVFAGLAALAKVLIAPLLAGTSFFVVAGEIFAVSQIYFNTIAKWFGLQVQ